MMPTFALPGLISPGQFGPMSRAPPSRTTVSYTTVMSWTGTPSVIATMVATPAAWASRIASFVNGAGTITMDVFAPVAATASATLAKIGASSSSQRPPPRFGWTPATTCVPYALLRAA